MSAALWKRIQDFVGVIADGIPGNATAEAVAQKLCIGETKTPIVPPGIDPRSAVNIATLMPQARDKANEWLLKCLAEGISVKIICGTRTYRDQDELYAQGRTKPGPKVTNARAGYSWHNFGTAWDFVVFDANGWPQWESPLMQRCGEIGESLGLEWGGRWTSPQDTPHLQLKPECTLAEARQRMSDEQWK